MSEEFNDKPTFAQRLKNLNVNRRAVVSGCVIAIAVITVTAIAIASNRAKKQDVEAPDTKAPTVETDKVETPVKDEVKEPVKDKPSSTPSVSTPVEDKLPSFVLPVSGALSSKHDADMQVFSNTMNDYRVHLGVDIVTSESAPVYAAADGKIDKIWKTFLWDTASLSSIAGIAIRFTKTFPKLSPRASRRVFPSVRDSLLRPWVTARW